MSPSTCPNRTSQYKSIAVSLRHLTVPKHNKLTRARAQPVDGDGLWSSETLFLSKTHSQSSELLEMPSAEEHLDEQFKQLGARLESYEI